MAGLAIVIAVWFTTMAAPLMFAASQSATPVSTLDIPRVEDAPTLEDFLDMKPSEKMQGHLAMVDTFIQQRPRDGSPSESKNRSLPLPR